MTPTRQSHPISDEDLDKRVAQAERIIEKIKGKEDIEVIIRDITPQEKWRTTPEELSLVYAIRNAICFYLYLYDLLVERTNLKQEVTSLKTNGGSTSLAIEEKRKFISSYSLFVMASSIYIRCEKLLKSKDQSKLSHLDNPIFDMVAGKGIENDLNYALSYFIDNLRGTTNGGTKLVQNSLDLLAVARDYWRKFATESAKTAKGCSSDLFKLVADTTFTHGKFSFTGLVVDDRQDTKVAIWAPIQPEEIIGDTDVTVLLARICDRLALYDPTLQKNPLAEFGGLVESTLIDGPPGTGKTSRFKMMMTRLAKRAEQAGIPYIFKSISADQIKSEWYGRTAQLISELLVSIKDPYSLALMMLDDIDLLLSGDRDGPGVGGGDKDIMKALMDFLSGTGTNYTGNYASVAATNKPTASDEALRQRFVYRAVILGPQSWEDYADLVAQELKGFNKTGLLGISDKGYIPRERKLPTDISSTYPRELVEKHNRNGNGTYRDIGHLCAELKKRDPRFTGRSVKNAIQVAVAKAADFEIPEIWFTKPDDFKLRTWDERLNMLRELYKKVSADQIMMALEYQFDTEQRYKVEAKEKEVSDLTSKINVQIAAQKRIESS